MSRTTDEIKASQNAGEEWRRSVIGQAVSDGTVIPAKRLFEPYQRYDIVAYKLVAEKDELSAFAMLDDLVARERGVYHINISGTKVWRNTDDVTFLKTEICREIGNRLNGKDGNGRALSYLEQWKDQPTPTQTLPIPDELKTARAIKAIERRLNAGT